MSYVITQACCNDAVCVSVCPVDAIHPRPDEPDFRTAEMLYINHVSCIDCNACAEACPVDAITPRNRLSEAQAPYADLNDGYFAHLRGALA